MKPVKFIGSSLDDLRNFPEEARRAAGFEIYTIQAGLDPSDWRGLNNGIFQSDEFFPVFFEYHISIPADQSVPNQLKGL